MTALDRAIPLAQVDDRSVLVGEDLNLDVAGVLEVALDVDGVVREVGLALTAGGLVGAVDLVGGRDDLESLPPASGGGLDRDRPSELVPQTANLVCRLHGLGRSRDDRDSCGAHRLAGGDLGAHQLHRLGGRTDPHDLGGLDRSREVGVLGEEPVTGVDRFGARSPGCVQDPLLVQVALRGRARADQKCLVREGGMQRAAVGLGVDRDRGDAELTQAFGRSGPRSLRGWRRESS